MTDLPQSLSPVTETLKRERDEARQLVIEANNSLYGSQGYFHSLNGGDFDKYHLARGIEDLKASLRGHAQRQPVTKPEPARWPAKGDLMTFLGKNGYERELTEALRIFKVGQQYRVLECNVQSWSHSVRFEDVAGWYNGVMFERVSDTSTPGNSK